MAEHEAKQQQLTEANRAATQQKQLLDQPLLGDICLFSSFKLHLKAVSICRYVHFVHFPHTKFRSLVIHA